MLVLAETTLSIRQAFGTGQLTEEITGQPFENFDVTMTYSHVGGSGPLPVTLLKKPGGFFALQFPPARAMPDFSAQTDVTLTVTIAIQGRAPFDVSQTVSATALALTDTVSKVGGSPITYRRINGAPFDFSAQVAPHPVALQGIILRDHDPANPISNVTVTTTPIGPNSAVTSDADGIFFIPALPVAEAITLDLEEGGTQIGIPFRPDFAKPVNRLILSLPTPNS